MAAELVEGGQVWVKLPYGEFVIQDTRDVVLFAGGTGITAFTAFLDGLTPEFPQHGEPVLWRAPCRLLIYRPCANEVAGHVPEFQPHYFVEEPDLAQNQGDVSSWPAFDGGRSGRSCRGSAGDRFLPLRSAGHAQGFLGRVAQRAA